ncbi:ferritin [Chitinivibrio alkaliphilus]|uniref:Ferritin n=1 Tax=Chitinivibrio alkaliphilus ACht1 TaxID=1313304 RepID=U7D817_9BACT|nr:ferritin [Chitinivibrio alkaliphilus]ERP31716.1 Ferroxidase [Chitinivibrio alkaliphilus ACht1]
MISENIQAALNRQINKELYSEYLYLAYAAFFAEQDLPGFENFFLVQVQEEHFHAMKMCSYLQERDGRVTLEKIDAPEITAQTPKDVFAAVLAHEQFVTASINEIVGYAVEENDFATKSFLDWFVDEQVEEEDSMRTILKKIELVGEQGHGLLQLDKEFAQRTFTPPTQ